MPPTHAPRTSLALVLLTLSACDPALDRLPAAGPDREPPIGTLAAAPTPKPVVIPLPDQITVDDADQLDPFDLTALHVPVPAGQEAVVMARASAIVATADPTTLPQPAIVALTSAQRLAAEIAHADVVATADVTAVTPVLEPTGSPTELAEVTFVVDVLLDGPTVRSWSSRLPEATHCGPVAPAVGDKLLVFLDGGASDAELATEAPFVPVVADTITLHGLTLSVTDLATIIQDNPETT
jgi:hypothetical protein